MERYCDDSFYAFSRGDLFIATTNRYEDVYRDIRYHPFYEGTQICNIYDDSDCLMVGYDGFKIKLEVGFPKIYYTAGIFKTNSQRES